MAGRVLAYGVLATLGAVWYWVLAQSPPPSVPDLRPAAGRVVASIPEPALVVRLDRLAGAGATRVRPLVQVRDPFRAAPARPALAAAVVRAAPLPDQAARFSATPAASWPRLALIGVAEAREDGAIVRTAIVSGGRGVHHVRPGDVVEQVYRLERIDDNGVDLRLLPEDRVLRLVLQP